MASYLTHDVFILLFILNFFIAIVTGQSCNVINQATKKSTSCRFPFIYNNRIFFGCTTYDDPDGKLWCSVSTQPSTHQHVTGNSFFGYCDDSCAKDDDFRGSNQYALELEQELIRLADDPKSHCPCVNALKCKWSKDVLIKANNMNRKHPFRRNVTDFIHSQGQGRSKYFGKMWSFCAMGGHSENFRSLGPPGAEIWLFL